jgi:tetrapyrrole methylase family protein / MazG family protein
MRNKLTIVGIADGKKENLTIKAYEHIQHAKHVYLQSGEISIAQEMDKAFNTFDDYYHEATDFDMLKEIISQKIIALLAKNSLTFCVLGDVAQNEIARQVTRDVRKIDFEVEIIGGLPCGLEIVSKALIAGEKSPVGIKAVSGYAFELQELFDEGLLIYEVDSMYLASEIKIKLLRFYQASKAIYIACKGKVTCISLEELDRQDGYGYAFSVYIPASSLEDKVGHGFLDLTRVMQKLRAKDGCPWDQKQTHESLMQFLIEESYEAYDAVAQDDMDMLYDELGDVLLQVVFHGQIGAEHSEFDAIDITSAICNKMINRHPHVFSDVSVDGADGVIKNWDVIKGKEKGIQSHSDNLRDVPKHMPSLMRSQKVQKRAAKCGFDWEDYRLPLEKVKEELAELTDDIKADKDPAEEMGDLLFAVTNLARHLKLDSEIVLYNGVQKFIDRFEKMEEMAKSHQEDLNDLPLEKMDEYWNMCKES